MLRELKRHIRDVEGSEGRHMALRRHFNGQLRGGSAKRFAAWKRKSGRPADLIRVKLDGHLGIELTYHVQPTIGFDHENPGPLAHTAMEEGDELVWVGTKCVVGKDHDDIAALLRREKNKKHGVFGVVHTAREFATHLAALPVIDGTHLSFRMVHEEVERWGLSWFNYLPLLHPQAVALLPGNYAGMAWDDAAAKEDIEKRPALAIDNTKYRETLLAIALESFLDRTMDEWPAVDEVDLDNIAEAVDNWPVNEHYLHVYDGGSVAPAPVSLALPFDWKPLAVKVAKRQGKTVTIGEQWACHPHIPCAHGLACNTKTNKCMKKGKTALRGKTVVFTGTFPETRKVMAAKAKKAGAKVAANLTKATDILVVGRKAGQKREKARKMAVKLMTEAQFRRALA